MVHTVSSFFIRTEHNLYRSMLYFRMFYKIFNHIHNCRNSSLVITTKKSSTVSCNYSIVFVTSRIILSLKFFIFNKLRIYILSSYFINSIHMGHKQNRFIIITITWNKAINIAVWSNLNFNTQIL